MTTADWADEEAKQLSDLWNGRVGAYDELNVDQGELASVLRSAFLRGRIAGLREAAEIADRFDWSAGELIREAADKLEKGEA